MNALTKPQPTATPSLVPQNMNDAMRLADMMVRAKTLPAHLQGPDKVGDALMVIEQAMRWQMSPFAVAQCTSVISGKLMFEGKLVAAAVQHSGILDGHFDYQFSGEGPTRKLVVSALRRGEAEPKTIELKLADAKTTNGMWVKQPDQQLVYAGTRVWARRWAPGVMLGVYAPEEFDEAQPRDTFAGTTVEGVAEPAVPEPPRKQTVAEWLGGVEAELVAAESAEAVDAIHCREDVQKALDSLRNGALARLKAAIQFALQRYPTDEPHDPATGERQAEV